MKAYGDTNKAHNTVVFFLLFVLIASIFFSKFILSASMIFLFALSIFHIGKRPGYFYINPRLTEIFRRWYNHKAYFWMTWIFLVPVITGLWSENIQEWVWRCRTHVPFIILPFVFLSLPKLDRKMYHQLMSLMTIIAFSTAVWVLLQYFNNSEHILDRIKVGKAMPTPINHIRYSLLIAYAVFTSLYLYLNRFHWRYKWESYIWIGIAISLFIFMHFLGVRSGIFSFYGTAFILILIRLIRSRFSYRNMMLVFGLMIIPVMAVQLVPSLRHKLSYMRWDIGQYFEGKDHHSSDARRIISLKGGIEVFKKAPILGVGAGDLKHEMKKFYQTTNIEQSYFPHNQFIFVLAGTGILGILIFLLAIIQPLVYDRAYDLLPLISVQLIVLISFMVENTLETSIGVAIYAFFICLGFKYLMDNDDAERSQERSPLHVINR